MPIDLKWVRQHPETVKRWQRQRQRGSGIFHDEAVGRRDHDNDHPQQQRQQQEDDEDKHRVCDVVDVCIQRDKISRQNLQTLEDLKRKLNLIQRRLRPPPPPPHAPHDATISDTTINTATTDHDNNNKDRERLLHERKQLQEQIHHQTKLYHESCQRTAESLWKIASPVDMDDSDVVAVTASGRLGGHDENLVGYDDEEVSFDVDVDGSDIDSNAVDISVNQWISKEQQLLLQRAFIEYTCQVFCRRYNTIAVPHGKIEVMPCGTTHDDIKKRIKKTSESISPSAPNISHDEASAMWGLDFASTCSHGDDNDVVLLPTWLRLLTDYNTSSSSSSSSSSSWKSSRKSIWGDKQLPVYAAIWGGTTRSTIATTTQDINDPMGDDDGSSFGEISSTKTEMLQVQSHRTLDLVALTASSLVDARIVRNQIVHDLKQFYESLLVSDTNCNDNSGGVDAVRHRAKCFVRRVAPHELECHEWSRIEIWVSISKDTNDSEGIMGHAGPRRSRTKYRLGTVSHWGDAISRAHGMIFASGGNLVGKNKKRIPNNNVAREYVHIVQASVVDDQTWHKIMHCNHHMCPTQDERRREGAKKAHLAVPSVVKQVLLDISNTDREKKKQNGPGVVVCPSDGTKGTVQSIFCPRLLQDTYKESSTISSVQASSTKLCSINTSSFTEPNIDEIFWREDVWTDEDEKNAQLILEQNLEKCTISSTLPSLACSTSSSEALSWDIFYQTHETKFFKDRHYLAKSFPEEFASPDGSAAKQKTLVEIGCGVGNAILPLLETNNENYTQQWCFVHGLDISPEAIRLLKEDPRFGAFNSIQLGDGGHHRAAYGHICDIAKDPLPSVCMNVADITTMLFCLSAIDPDDMPTAAATAAASLKPGGVLCFRDYGRYDEAQMKLGTSRSKLVKDNFYRKSDGTKCYYFSLEDLERLFVKHAGLETVDIKTLRRAYPNKATGRERRRVWVQGRFRKPMKAQR